MKPLGRTPKRFPSKTDCHPRKGYINWWEEENDDGNKAKERERAKKEMQKEISDIFSVPVSKLFPAAENDQKTND